MAVLTIRLGVAGAGLNRTERLEALRALLNAIDPSEQTLRVDIAAMSESSRSQEQEIGHRAWEIRKLRKQLLEVLGVADDELAQGLWASKSCAGRRRSGWQRKPSPAGRARLWI